MTQATVLSLNSTNILKQAQVFEEEGNYKQAFLDYFKAYQQDKNNLLALLKSAVLLEKQGHTKQAYKLYCEGLQSFPDSPELCNNLGNIYKNNGELKTALKFYKHSIKNNNSIAEPFSNIGSILQLTGHTEEAINYFHKALSINNTHSPTLLNLGLSQLLSGDFENGLKNYEHRLKESNLSHKFQKITKWQGESLKEKSILIITEQGFGDTIQFARYLPLLKQQGAIIDFQCQEELIPLFKNSKYIDNLYSSEAIPNNSYDFVSPLLSLPLIFKTNNSTIPDNLSSITLESTKVNLWQKRLTNPVKVNVGLIWSGSSTHKHDRYRSIALTKLSQLVRFSHFRLFSFQKGPAENQLKPFEKNIVNLSPFITDFSDTAAMLKSMDVVITVDTSVAHLASTLGIPTKLLLAYTPDWRWQLKRTDSPWYSSVQLYRQKQFNDWSDPVNELIQDLKSFRKKLKHH